MDNNTKVFSAFAAGAALGALAVRFMSAKKGVFSMPDQPARFAAQKAANCVRALNIEKVFEPSLLKGKRVLVTGGNRGLGLAIAKELVACGAHTIITCRKLSPEVINAGIHQVIEQIDVQSDDAMERLVKNLDAPIDILINNAGYFKVDRESVLDGTMDFSDEVMTIDICAVGPLRVSNALWRAGKIVQGGKVAMITSQGGSIEWRDVQCPNGGDYGHHMSKAAANMAGKLFANEMKGKLLVSNLHPGFNRTEMTSKYSHIWDIEGAVDSSVGAKRVLHEINVMTPETTGAFINCEDGLPIPW